jgi:hypothetical protein
MTPMLQRSHYSPDDPFIISGDMKYGVPILSEDIDFEFVEKP